jgi:hypothetical protein
MADDMPRPRIVYRGIAALPGNLTWTAAYFGAGAGCHYLALGDRFEVRSVLSWAWLSAWPLCGAYVLAAVMLPWVLIAVAALVAVVLALMAIAWCKDRLNRRRWARDARRYDPLNPDVLRGLEATNAQARRSYSEAGAAHHDNRRG